MLIKLKESLSQDDTARICSGTLQIENQKKISVIVTDSREVCPDSLFVAICGENFDGHCFLEMAAKNGACAVLVEKNNAYAAEFSQKAAEFGCSMIFVDDTTVAFGKIAKAWLDALHIKVLAVTGSVGKTTTKQLCASVLSEKYRLKKTEGNHNNELGLPYTLFSLERSDEMAVLEMGMSRRGEISYLSRLAKPEIAVITNVGTSHIENLGSREEIAAAKLEIADGMPDGSVLLLNGDEPLLKNAAEKFPKLCVKYVSGIDETADIYICNIVSDAVKNSIYFDVYMEQGKHVMTGFVISGIGSHLAFDAAFAVAAGFYLGLSEDQIRKGLAQFENTGLRQKITQRDGCTFIEDCYNASCEAMIASLQVLWKTAEQKRGRSIAVLGEMRELGDYSDSLHYKVGLTAARFKISKLFVLGEKSLPIVEGAKSGGMSMDDIVIVKDINDKEGLAEKIKAELLPGDVILFKASRAVALEQVIERI